MERGVLLICFDRKSKGQAYMKQAQACVGSIRAFSDIPVHIVTNLTTHDSDRLRQMKNEHGVSIQYVDAADSENRRYKTDMYALSPFNTTMFTDTDTVVRKKQFLDGFEFVTKLGRDVAMPFHHGEEWLGDVERPGSIHQLVELTGSKYLCYWCSGTLFWNRTPGSQELFHRWHRIYSHRQMQGQDMLPLNLAVAHTPSCNIWPLPWVWSCQDEDDSRAVICHIGGMTGQPMACADKFTHYEPCLEQHRTRKLIAGPYFGELGWEVAVWVPHVHFLVKKYQFDSVKVYCQAGHEALYPFATDFATFRLEHASLFTNSNWMDRPDRVAVSEFKAELCAAAADADAHCKHCSWVKHVYGDGFNRLYEFPKQRTPVLYDNISIPTMPANSIVLAYRHLKRGADKNTDIKALNALCDAVLDMGFTPVILGQSFDDDEQLKALHPRAINCVNNTLLVEFMSFCRGAKAVVGPSTGTMHLASACGVPHVTWGGGTRGKAAEQRYLKTWNPHNTWCRFLGYDWQVDTQKVIEAVKEAVQQARKEG
jgi:hypothetical protein